MNRKNFLARTAAALALASFQIAGSAADISFQRPITIIVPFVAGSPTDVVARGFATELGNVLGSPVIVDNKPGASQTVATSYVARSNPDGTTLVLVAIPAIVPPAITKLPYKDLNDFATVSKISTNFHLLVGSPHLPANNLKEFIALLKADPNNYSFGSSGIASAIHLIAEQFNRAVGVNTLHVPYKGANEVQLDLMSDRISYAFLPISAMESVKTGKLKAFGFAADKRDPLASQVPTIAEEGMNFKAPVGFYLLASRDTPAPVVSKLNAAANKVITGEAFNAKLKAQGGAQVGTPGTPKEIAGQLAAEQGGWEKLAKELNIKYE